jgi:lysophospholipase L1-like esterase
MNRKTKLLAVGLAVMVVLVSIAAYLVEEVENKKGATTPIRVACVGDSITKGFGYPYDLSTLLDANYVVGNFGAGGAAISLGARNPYMNQTAFQDAKQFQPNIVIIMLGANDASPENEGYIGSFVGDYLKLVDSFEALASKPRIWIVKPPPILHNGTGLSTEFYDAKVIPSIEQAAKAANLSIIDVYSAFANHSDYLWDGVHPTSPGSQLIAKEIYTAISSK